MAKFHFDVDQGSADWFKLRAGIPTASEFDKVITPQQMKLSAQRRPYQCRLIAERLLNWQAESLDKVKHIMEGKENEPNAVAQLEFVAEIETRKVGFVTTDDGRFGASPDRLVVGRNVVVEVKCPTIPKQLEYLLLPRDDAYRCQVQGQLFVAEADEAIFYAYQPRMPAHMLRTNRDEEFIGKLHAALEQFSDELEEMTERARSLGIYQAFAEVVTPAEAELGDGLRHDPVADLTDWIEGA